MNLYSTAGGVCTRECTRRWARRWTREGPLIAEETTCAIRRAGFNMASRRRRPIFCFCTGAGSVVVDADPILSSALRAWGPVCGLVLFSIRFACASQSMGSNSISRHVHGGWCVIPGGISNEKRTLNRGFWSVFALSAGIFSNCRFALWGTKHWQAD
jgi:hypothetical protein